MLQDGRVQCQFNTLVRGLADVALHRGIADGGDGAVDEQVLYCIPVEVQATADTLVEESEIQTDVAGDGGLPFQVGVGQL